MIDRYARQSAVIQACSGTQDSLAQARVLVVGLGGLGVPVLQYLVGAGLGFLRLVDGDTVELHNLHRQTIYRESEVGEYKVRCAQRFASALNNAVETEIVTHPLTPANVDELLHDVDVVVDCADNIAATYTLSDVCMQRQLPFISASALEMAGYVGGFCAGVPSLRAVFPFAPDQLMRCEDSGVLGPVVGTLGCLQAQWVLSVLLGQQPSPLGSLLRVDLRNARFSSFTFHRAAEPQDAFPFISEIQIKPTDRVIELRDRVEAPRDVCAQVERATAESIATLQPQADCQRTVLCCRTGLRAWRAAEQIRPNWAGELVLLAAGDGKR